MMINEQEAFIEANARYLYCRLLSIWFPKKTFQEYWKLELRWMKQQANFLRSSRWTTDTNTVAYYMFTIALLYAPRCAFLKWMYTSRSRSDKQMQREWIQDKRYRWWNQFYKQSDFWLPRTNTSCMSMRMVFTQIKLK